jgi:hypothetical protein
MRHLKQNNPSPKGKGCLLVGPDAFDGHHFALQNSGCGAPAATAQQPTGLLIDYIKSLQSEK